MSDYAGDAVLITLEGTREGLAPIQSLFAKIFGDPVFSRQDLAQRSRHFDTCRETVVYAS
jgi:hypothetical protein